MIKRRAIAAVLLALAAIPIADADESLWGLLKGGGQVVLMRHAVTTPGVGDPEGMRLGDCATQRNLSDEGRAHAKQVGEAFRARKGNGGGDAAGRRQVRGGWAAGGACALRPVFATARTATTVDGSGWRGALRSEIKGEPPSRRRSV